MDLMELRRRALMMQIEKKPNLIPDDDPNDPNANYVSPATNPIVYDTIEQAFTKAKTLDPSITQTGISYSAHAGRNPNQLFVANHAGVYVISADYKNISTNYGLRVYKNVGGTATRLGDMHGAEDGKWHTRSITVELGENDYLYIYFYGNIYWRNLRVVEAT